MYPSKTLNINILMAKNNDASGSKVPSTSGKETYSATLKEIFSPLKSYIAKAEDHLESLKDEIESITSGNKDNNVVVAELQALKDLQRSILTDISTVQKTVGQHRDFLGTDLGKRRRSNPGKRPVEGDIRILDGDRFKFVGKQWVFVGPSPSNTKVEEGD